VDYSDWNGVEEVLLGSTNATGDDQVRVLEDAQVLHHTKTSHAQVRLELRQRLPIAHEQAVEQGSPRGIGERPKDRVVGVGQRIPSIRDLLVTCQARLPGGRGRLFGAMTSPPSLEDETARSSPAAMARATADWGARLGRYIPIEELGRGGMGRVLRAYDPQLQREVALKLLHDELDEGHTARLLREAQAMAKLSHPNVVQVYEADRVGDQTFVAMELVEGRTLRAWMRQQPRPDWRTSVELFVQLGAGLAAAHERGLVHRDFKPGNAIIDGKGRPRVLDFGLARKLDAEANDEPNHGPRPPRWRPKSSPRPASCSPAHYGPTSPSAHALVSSPSERGMALPCVASSANAILPRWRLGWWSTLGHDA
jgi:Protein kinase domain